MQHHGIGILHAIKGAAKAANIPCEVIDVSLADLADLTKHRPPGIVIFTNDTGHSEVEKCACGGGQIVKEIEPLHITMSILKDPVFQRYLKNQQVIVVE